MSCDAGASRSLVLWGASGHGKVVLEIARAMACFEDIFFIDDGYSGSAPEFCGCRVYGAGHYLRSLSTLHPPCFAISIGKNDVRAACCQRALDCGLKPATLIHPSAVVSRSACIGPGTVVMPRAILNANARIGRNCIINTGAVVEHDCVIGDHTHLSPSVTLGGAVTVGEYVHMGIGAIAIPGARIGDRTIIGAGAVILHEIPPGVKAVGVPARILTK